MQYKKLVATEIPRECIEFLARSWSLSATELLKALANKCMVASVGNEMRGARSTASREPIRFRHGRVKIPGYLDRFRFSIILKPCPVSVAGVSAAVAALAASNPMVTETATTWSKTSIKESTAMAFAAALVASHCIEIAEDMGADHEQILTVV
ncbi:hypothetical protein V6N13_062326 [Hibiscus sabdariffa]|uniref:VAN3-binding protein-like auxin canalisation domain-containing protein n=1 Tax=Hibiscus sabdariffa TaxID=183260 RepID=A0ABR2BRQ9_9ROSI